MRRLLNSPRSFVIYSVLCILIFVGFFVQDYIEHNNYKQDDGYHIDSYKVWDETAFTEGMSIIDESIDRESIKIPETTDLTIFIDEVSEIKEDKNLARIKGAVKAEWNPKTGIVNPGSANLDDYQDEFKRNIFEAIEINFATPEGSYFKRAWGPLAYDYTDKIKSLYKFNGLFKVINDASKFPFDTAQIPIVIDTPGLTVAEVRLHGKEAEDSDPSTRTGAFLWQKHDCGYGGEWSKEESVRNICTNNIITSGLTYDDKSKYLADDRINHPDAVANVLNSNPGVESIIYFKRSAPSSFFRFVAPILFVMVVAMLFDYLENDAWEIKLAIPPTILLTLIFMHNGYRTEISQVSYINWLDKFYLCAYVSCILILIGGFAKYMYYRGKWKDISEARHVEMISERNIIWRIPRYCALIAMTIVPIAMLIT